jgi:hypothetical protein
MGGIGKTQLAVHYVYLYKADYPDGIFWVNAAMPLADGLAQIGRRLHPDTLDKSPAAQLFVAYEELKKRRDALVVLDNLQDPSQLHFSIDAEDCLLTLPCHLLFTTRTRNMGHFRPIEVSVLPEEHALRLLLRDEPAGHPQRQEAERICRLLGFLPLAVDLAGAYLANWPEVSLADYRRRLEAEGCISTLDSDAEDLPQVNFQPTHEAAIAATLKTQWDLLNRGAEDEAARQLFRVAGQFREASEIPVSLLGLLTDIPDVGSPGKPSPLRKALRRLYDLRLIDELHENKIRLHPLVREFARSRTTEHERIRLKHYWADNLRRGMIRSNYPMAAGDIPDHTDVQALFDRLPDLGVYDIGALLDLVMFVKHCRIRRFDGLTRSEAEALLRSHGNDAQAASSPTGTNAAPSHGDARPFHWPDAER